MGRIASISDPGVSNPFTVTWRVNPNDPTGQTFQGKVLLKSFLYASDDLKNDKITITGLDVWFPLLPNDTIWLFATVTTTFYGWQVNASPIIHNFGSGNSDYIPSAGVWSTGSIAENDNENPPNQTLFRKIIAESIADANGKPSITQYVWTHLVMRNGTLGGLGADIFAAFYPRSL